MDKIIFNLTLSPIVSITSQAKKEDVMVSVHLEIKNKGKGIVVLEMENTGSEAVSISSDSILLDGFTSDKFKITDICTGNNIIYEGRYVKYKPKKLSLGSYEKIQSELDLTQVYDLEDCHKYDISFESYALISGESVSLSGGTVLEMECNN